MKEKLICAYLRRKLAFLNALENFAEEERGASDMVTILVIIVIVIGVAATFKTELGNAVTTAFAKLTTFINQ